jgi:O-antigen ligase
MNLNFQSQQFINKSAQVLTCIFIFSVFLLPPLPIVNSFPKIQVAEILLPFICLLLLLKFPQAAFKKTSNYVLLWSLLLVVMFLSIAANGRLDFLNDYFEVFKVFKYLIFLLFLTAYIDQINIIVIVRLVFVLVVIFNVLHYFNWMDFNDKIMPYYCSETHITFFGFDSEGGESTKRIVGTASNPNTNAILFLFFAIFFFPAKQSTLTEKIFFFLAILGLFSAQSRTALIAFIPVYLILALNNQYQWKEYLFTFLPALLLFLFVVKMGNTYVTVMGKAVVKTNSVRGRLAIWMYLWEMIKEKPLLGYAPSKDFFYSRKLYPESEYVLYCWRYGFAGLLVLLSIMIYPIRATYKYLKHKEALNLFVYTLVFIITSITNNPFSDQNLLLIYCLMAAMFFAKFNKIVNSEA